MSPYKGKVVFITGASSGIGAGIAEALVKDGMIVVGAARRVERIQKMATKLKGQPGKLVPRKLDVNNEQEIIDTVQWIDSELGGLSVLINNAAVFIGKAIYDMTTEEMKSMLDVNLLSLSICIREAVNSFTRRNISDGYIININSITGLSVPHYPHANLGLYPATKHAMRAMGITLRHSLHDAKIKVRLTNISPGCVLTEMTEEHCTNGAIDNYLEVEHVARSVAFVLSMPLKAEITELTIRPAGEVSGQ